MSNSSNEISFDARYKILLLGDTRVGKTSLQRFAAGKEFRPEIGSTIGVDFVNKIIPVEKSKINLQIWDTAGQRSFRTIGKSHYTSTKAFVLVYDVTDRETFDLIEQFNKLIEQAGLDTERRYLIANKIDLDYDRIIDQETGQRFAFRHSMIYFETSCKTGENIDDLFDQIASDLVRQHNPKLLESHHPVKDNFAFNYQTPTMTHRPTSQNTDHPTRPAKNKTAFSSLSYESIDDHPRWNFRRLIICCRPRKTS